MAPDKTRGRRDSFGLEVRRDGTLAFDFGQETLQGATVKPVTRKAPQNERRSGTGSGSSRGASANGHGAAHAAEPRKPEPQKSVPKARQRRDSFGLEVRADGTLSLDQLVRGGRESSALGNSGRGGMELPGVVGINERVAGRSRSMATLPSTRRDPDQPTHHPQTGRLHPSTPGTFNPHPATAQRATEISVGASTASEPRISQRRMNSGVELETVEPDNSEVRMLRERVQRLEAALGQRDRSSDQNGNETEMPPAYESRPSTPAP